MKVLLLSFEYPAETGFGGIGTYTWYHARALVKLGHEVHVLAGALATTALRTSEHDGVIVHRYRSGGAVMRSLALLARPRLWWTRNRLENALCMYRGLAALRRQHRYDVVEMPECGAEGMLINHLTRAMTVVRLHSPARLIMPYYDVRSVDITLCAFAEQRGIGGARALSSCSAFLAGEASEKLGVRRSIRVIPNGIDLDLFDASEQIDFRRSFDLPADRPIIFFAGRLERRKGIHLCRDIAAAILERHDVAFVMAGQDLFDHATDDLLPHLAARSLKGSIHYLGRLDLDTVRSGLRQSDIFLLPSLWENCPYSCLEAMAAGRAIVSSDQGGMPELIRDGENGLLATNGSAASYVAALERLIADSALRLQLGNEARASIRRRHTDVFTARQSIEYYTDCLRGAA